MTGLRYALFLIVALAALCGTAIHSIVMIRLCEDGLGARAHREGAPPPATDTAARIRRAFGQCETSR